MRRSEWLCYTDGSCKAGDESPGGWGFYVRAPDGAHIEGHGSATRTLAKVMEYVAVAEALARLPEGATATVFSDNQSLVANLEKKLDDWRASDFRNVDVTIAESVRRIAAEIADKRLRITWKWLRAHNGNVGNDRADALAAQGARQAKRGVPHP